MVGIAEIPIDPDADPATEFEDAPQVAVAVAVAAAAASLASNLRLTFCLAGHAIFTLRNSLTENRFTFKIRRKKPDHTDSDRSPLFWVSVLVGPENTSDYTYLGFIATRTTGSEFIPSRKHRSAQSAGVFAWAWPRIVAGTLPPEIEFHHAGRCGRCGRLLTCPESVASGIGPKCAELAVNR